MKVDELKAKNVPCSEITVRSELNFTVRSELIDLDDGSVGIQLEVHCDGQDFKSRFTRRQASKILQMCKSRDRLVHIDLLRDSAVEGFSVPEKVIPSIVDQIGSLIKYL